MFTSQNNTFSQLLHAFLQIGTQRLHWDDKAAHPEFLLGCHRFRAAMPGHQAVISTVAGSRSLTSHTATRLKAMSGSTNWSPVAHPSCCCTDI
jgi:hypothetical protein